VAHAEASARTVDAAVTAAAAQLGLRSDQVDVEVLEEPVPSTFGYIGTPARVRVTPRATATASSGPASPASGSSQVSGLPTPTASLDVTATPSPGSAGATVPGPGSAAAGTERDSTAGPAAGSERGAAGDPAASGSGGGSVGDPAAGSDVVLGQPDATAPDLAAGPTASAIAAATPADLAGSSERATAGSADVPSSGESTTTQAPEGTIAPSPQDISETTNIPNDSAPSSGAEPSGTSPAVASTPAGATPVAAAASTAEAATPSAASAAGNGQDARPTTAPAEGATGGAPRASRRTSRDRDEPIAPEMVEEDTERAGDFLEGLLDALDVDGDITTWVDEVGGHIDLEGADLEPLVGPNGETLDSLQELTRLAVLRQSKRRVRLLLDINRFRARQRDQLTSIVRTTAEQVIKTREDHEFQPMSPAERKIVHDAVAAIDGVRTESWGEDPNRRVVIRPT
jgi:spoIIIJ-associated protein